MNKRYIYLPIEIKSRELWPKVWLSISLANRGFTCILGDKPGVKTAMLMFPKGIYFDKSISKRKNNALRDLSKQCHAIVCQDEEAGIVWNDLGVFFKERISEENISLIANFFCWGDADYRFLTKAYSGSSRKFLNTGSPRVDLWQPETAPIIYRRDITSLRRRYRDYFLVNSAFGIVNRDELRTVLAYQSNKVGLSDAEIANMEQYFLKKLGQLTDLVNAINELATNMPDVNFVVRPHPAESMRGWKDLLERRENLYLVRDGDVTPWIAACKALIHPGCTTAFQAVLMGKPTISFEGYGDTGTASEAENIANQISIRTASVEGLREIIHRIRESENDLTDGARKCNGMIIQKRIRTMDDGYAADRIAKAIDELDISEYEQPSKLSMSLRYGKTVIANKVNRISRIRNRLIGYDDVNRSARNNVKIPGGIRGNEIEEFIERSGEIGRQTEGIFVRQVGVNTYVITNDD